MFLVYLLANILTLLGLDQLLESLEVDSLAAAFLFVLLLSALNTFVAPVIKLLTFPINFVTLGLFNTLVNLAVLALSVQVIDGVRIAGDRVESLLVLVIIALSFSVVHGIIGHHREKRKEK